MSRYTYFIVSPGYDAGSFIRYPDGAEGCYVKFGDTKDVFDEPGIRAAYMTHNPDIGVVAVMGSDLYPEPPYLGTRLKQFIRTDIGIAPVRNGEWFSVQTRAMVGLFNAMLAWNNRHVTPSNLQALHDTLSRHLR